MEGRAVWNKFIHEQKIETGRELSLRVRNYIAELEGLRTKAGLQAVKLESEMEFPSVTVMGDSLIIIKKCKVIKRDKSAIGPIIHDIHNRINRFEDLRFQFLNRTENDFAHKIAVEVLKKEEETYLIRGRDDFPEGR
ncbi:hypothetical protein PVK06_036872 [Gossypium arboreum]|uniref:RNase H type-1 domain-containing protein n=1 Tax=Gossypium arboreum TaxID=29729 RepID=A0ABR0NN63_GOSAR|nr:hypothetical protein PVK06_036872 [Gossypium arboreum]